MDQLTCASLSPTHYWCEVGMLEVPAACVYIKRVLSSQVLRYFGGMCSVGGTSYLGNLPWMTPTSSTINGVVLQERLYIVLLFVRCWTHLHQSVASFLYVQVWSSYKGE